jgi:2-amino-4-hydroxy-6-hydroxymethyldihydropteridine diphosphokinase
MNSNGRIYIALGGNLPFEAQSPQDTLRRCLQVLAGQGVQIRAVSDFWRSPAWPDPAKPEYINAAAEIETALEPIALLDLLLAVERQFGRVRESRWDSRTLDLDLIDYAGRIIDCERLTLPHPRAAHRAFVLLPLQDIAPDWRDPASEQSIADLVAALPASERRAVTRIAG